jgi:hypothetical protein
MKRKFPCFRYQERDFSERPAGQRFERNRHHEPRTRVTAYIVNADRKGSYDREVKRVGPAKPTTRPAEVMKTPAAKRPVAASRR